MLLCGSAKSGRSRSASATPLPPREGGSGASARGRDCCSALALPGSCAIAWRAACSASLCAAAERQHPGEVGPRIGELRRDAQRGLVAGDALLIARRDRAGCCRGCCASPSAPGASASEARAAVSASASRPSVRSTAAWLANNSGSLGEAAAAARICLVGRVEPVFPIGDQAGDCAAVGSAGSRASMRSTSCLCARRYQPRAEPREVQLDLRQSPVRATAPTGRVTRSRCSAPGRRRRAAARPAMRGAQPGAQLCQRVEVGRRGDRAGDVASASSSRHPVVQLRPRAGSTGAETPDGWTAGQRDHRHALPQRLDGRGAGVVRERVERDVDRRHTPPRYRAAAR